MKKKYSAVDALKEHLLAGNKITVLEAQALFGVQNLYEGIALLRRQGFLINKQKIPMARIIRRMNQFCAFAPPKDLPVIEIKATEWWIQID